MVCRNKITVLFVITLCLQAGVSYAAEGQAQQSRSFKDRLCSIVCKALGFNVSRLEKQDKTPASRTDLLLSLQTIQYLNNAQAYIAAQPSNQKPLFKMIEKREKYEKLSDEIHYALHSKKNISQGLMNRVRVFMRKNDNPISQSVALKWDFANRRYVRDAQKFLDARLFTLRTQELLQEMYTMPSMKVARKVDDFLVFAHNRELLIEPTNGKKTSRELYKDFGNLLQSQMSGKTALKPQYLDKHI